jgi:hypothetical protein
MLPGIKQFLMSAGVLAQTTAYASDGSFSFEVPAYNTLTIEGWGAGGGGASAYSGSTFGADGGDTIVTVGATTLTANGGDGGVQTTTAGVSSNGGTASGGDVNTTGGSGVSSLATAPTTRGRGGHAPNGLTTTGGQGDTTTNPANAPGAGGYGSDPENYSSWVYASGGGAGGYFRKVFTFGQPGAPAIGSTINITVGAGGASSGGANAGAGADGRVEVKVA